MIATSFIKHDVAFLASVFSFGVLIAFTAAQLAVIKLRITEPDLPRPYRAPLNVTIRGAEIPLPGDRRRAPHLRGLDPGARHAPRARYAGPAWLAIGLVVYVGGRRSHGEG